MSRTLPASVLLGLAILLTPVFAVWPDSVNPWIELLRQLPHMPDQERVRVLENLSAEREQFGSVVESALENAKTDEARIAAAFLLGEYRMEKSAALLNQYLTLKATLPQKRFKEGLWHEYPVVEALVRIEKPSIRFMIENLAKSDDDLVRRLSVRVILAVDGAEIGKLHVTHAAEKAQAAERRRLEECLPLFESEADRSSTPTTKSG